MYSTDRVVFQKSSPASGAIFSAHRKLSQTSAQASSATAILPTANPPRSHHKTTQLPVELAEGSISTVEGAYHFYRGGRISNCWWHQHDWRLRNFPYTCILLSVRHVRTTNTMIRLHMHRLICTCAFGGNLHLAGICAWQEFAKANFFYGFKIHVS